MRSNESKTEKALTQTAALLIVEYPDSKQMNDYAVCIKYVKSSRVHRMHTCICLGGKTTCPQKHL